MTRCTEGCIAYIRKCSNSQNLGAWVEVLRPAVLTTDPSEPAWMVRRLGHSQLLCYDMVHGTGFSMSDEAKCPDAWLTPLTGPIAEAMRMRAHALRG